ncbi:MAG: leucine-rich repeat protein [Oscillospiraceae bacterium]|nr:leucine-rich repeat protein [Oscillospiraceae bacterium]
MFCPKCNAPRPNDPVFCSECGTTLIAPPKPKKGKLWPPLVFLAVMFTIGCVVFALTYAPKDNAPSATPWFSVEDGVLFFDYSLYTGDGNLVVPETVNGEKVTALSDGCFSDCDTLTSVTLPDSLITIGDKAFSDCNKLRGVKLTENVTSIGAKAFYSCAALEAVYVPASVQTIGNDAFGRCTALRNVFFVGDIAGWNALYPQKINPNTRFYRVDGPNSDSYSPL